MECTVCTTLVHGLLGLCAEVVVMGKAVMVVTGMMAPPELYGAIVPVIIIIN